MDVFEAIKIRRSVRRYRQDLVPEEKLKRILEAARLAPSAHNEQEWRFIVVKDLKKRNELAGAAGQSFICQAPIIIVAVATDPEHLLSSGVPAYALDLAVAVDHMTLVAVEEGLGTCWIGAFDQDKVKRILEVPERYKVVALLPLGFPADTPGSKIRKDISEIVSYNRF
jgi:nitroreductase